MRYAKNELKKFVIVPSRSHISFWMEERGTETNGHDDPIGNPKVSLKFFLDDPRCEPRVSSIYGMVGHLLFVD